MLVAEEYLGHRGDPAVADLLDAADGDPHRVALTDTERQRSRVRTETADGRDLGIVVADELADGDVLATADGDLVVVDLAAVEVLVVDFSDADVAATAALEVGHALGNRHWDLAVREHEALFPVADTRERTATTVADLLPAGVTTRFETVSPATFDDATPEHGDDEGEHSHHHPYDGGGHDGHAHPHIPGIRTVGGDDDE